MPKRIPLISWRLTKKACCLVGVPPPNLKRSQASLTEAPRPPANMEGTMEEATVYRPGSALNSVMRPPSTSIMAWRS